MFALHSTSPLRLARNLARISPRALVTRLTHALAVRRERVYLARLDDALLRDIGLTRAQAMEEAGRPLWDLAPTRPAQRRQCCCPA